MTSSPHACAGEAKPRLLVDVSAISRKDVGTGIQRVTREIMRAWLAEPPAGHEVLPVRFGHWKDEIHSARAWAAKACGATHWEGLGEERVVPRPGDVFVGLDVNMAVALHGGWLRRHQARGMRACFLCHDLIPLATPHFPPLLRRIFLTWLAFWLRHADGVICISRAVMADVEAWCADHPPARRTPLLLGWSHNGARPLAAASPAAADCGIPGLDRSRPVFLMVGTVEPRKGYVQALAAFEKLWEGGSDAQLVVIGQPGWMMQAWVECARAHPELGKRFFWPGHVSDQQLQAIYRSSTALVAASEAEGFGLPLIEAAQYGLPVIARDMPIFREVAGEHAFFFQGKTPEELAAALGAWLALHAKGKAPASTGMKWSTWAESARRLAAFATAKADAGGPWSLRLPPKDAAPPDPQELRYDRYRVGWMVRHPLGALKLLWEAPVVAAWLLVRNPGSFFWEKEAKP